MAYGRVKWFNETKGFGFIELHGGNLIFVHYSAILSNGYKSLNEGELVEFEVYDTQKGPHAQNVQKKE